MFGNESIKKQVDDLTRNELTLRRAAKEEEETIKKIITIVKHNLENINVTLKKHQNETDFSNVNTSSTLSALIPQITHGYDVWNRLTKLEKLNESPNLVYVGKLAEKISKFMLEFKKALQNGEFKSRENIIVNYKKYAMYAYNHLESKFSQQIKVDEYILKEA
jgi:hypothetical protein